MKTATGWIDRSNLYTALLQLRDEDSQKAIREALTNDPITHSHLLLSKSPPSPDPSSHLSPLLLRKTKVGEGQGGTSPTGGEKIDLLGLLFAFPSVFLCLIAFFCSKPGRNRQKCKKNAENRWKSLTT